MSNDVQQSRVQLGAGGADAEYDCGRSTSVMSMQRMVGRPALYGWSRCCSTHEAGSLFSQTVDTWTATTGTSNQPAVGKYRRL